MMCPLGTVAEELAVFMIFTSLRRVMLPRSALHAVTSWCVSVYQARTSRPPLLRARDVSVCRAVPHQCPQGGPG